MHCTARSRSRGGRKKENEDEVRNVTRRGDGERAADTDACPASDPQNGPDRPGPLSLHKIGPTDELDRSDVPACRPAVRSNLPNRKTGRRDVSNPNPMLLPMPRGTMTMEGGWRRGWNCISFHFISGSGMGWNKRDIINVLAYRMSHSVPSRCCVTS